MAVETTSIEGLLVVDWATHADDRGFFRQTYQRAELEEALGRPISFAQGNHSRSDTGVIRAFHAEPWDKLVYVARGVVRAVVADIREDSPTFGQTASFLLGDPPGERRRLFISEGLANGFGVIEGPADYVYDVTAVFQPGIDKRAVRWDDPDLAVDWGIEDPIVSPADADHPSLRDRFPDRF